MLRLRAFVTVRRTEDIPQYDAIQNVVAKAELKLIQQIVKMSTEEFNPISIISSKSDRLRELLELKRTDPNAGEARLPNVPVVRASADLMEALKASLAKLKTA